MKYIIPFSFLLLFGLFSCDRGQQILKDDIEEIENYLSENNIVAQRTDSDLFYVVDEEGNGEFPELSDLVTVDYEGYFTNGIIFDSSIIRGEAATFGLSQVIRGWQEGIPLFSKGGKGRLFIPSHLAYGERGTSGIDPNTVIIFDVHLIDF